ncbi:MAG: MATE family efflux transporter [Planctomycetes bacterium]|nr:MATE family efflux transporter [Planctomycetota bacterium]
MNQPATVELTTAASAASGPALPAPSWRLVIALAMPVLAQQGLAFLVLLSDRWLAGHLVVSDQAAVQAAQTTAHYLAWFITCYNVLVTVGSTALVARFIGASERRRAVEVTHQALLLAVVLGAAATAWAFLGGVRWMVDLLKLRDAAADYATDYALILFGLIVFQTIEVASVACLVGAGDTRTGMWIMAGVALINVPLAWGFSRGYGPLPNLGFIGIALGTALSHVLGGTAGVIVLARGRFGLKLSPTLFWPRLDLLYRLLRVSVPAGLDSLSVVVGQFWFLSLVNQLGNEASSAHGIALVWEGLGYLSGAAFGTAAMTLVGQNLGARRPHQATRAGWMAFALGCAVMTGMGLTFYSFAYPMFWLFCPNPGQADIIATGVPALRLIAFAMPPLAAMIIFTSALRGAGDTRVPVLFTWVGFFLVRIPLAYYLSLGEFPLIVPVYFYELELGPFHGLDLGLYGCWLAMCADILVRGLFFLARFARGAWQRQRV